MGFITWIASGLLILHTAHSYIILTANLDDVNTVAKQVIRSPVASELVKIGRRAFNQFSKQYNKELRVRAQKRNNDKENGMDSEGARDQSRNEDQQKENQEKMIERRNQESDGLVALGKTASVYLNSIKKIFEQI